MSEPVSRWRSAVVAVAGIAAVVCVAMYGPPDARGEAFTAIGGIVSVVIMRHAGQDREKASP